MTSIVVPAHISAVAARLQARGYAAVVVGGAVRDQMLGRRVKDWDLATSATPDQVVAIFPGTRGTTRFGTALVPAGREVVEVTTFRTEAGYADFRRPDRVAFSGSLEEDLARRDFTMNAIAYDPIKKVLVDPFGGRADLAARRIRAVGVPAERFGEDALRLIRAVRFVAQLGFSIEASTASAIRSKAPLARHLAAERVGTELSRMVTSEHAAAGLTEMARLGLAEVILPDLDARSLNDGVAVLRASKPTTQAAAFAALLHHAGSDGTAGADLARRRILALGIGEDIALPAARMIRVARLPFQPGWTEADLARALRPFDRPTVIAGMALRRRCSTIPGTDALDRRIAALVASGLPVRLADLAVNGDDLIRSAGVPAGPRLGRILDALLESCIERRVQNVRPALIAEAIRLRTV